MEFSHGKDVPGVVVQASFSKDVSPVDRNTETAIMESNAPGLEFTSEADIFEARAVATSTQQAESLRAPLRHQGGRGYDRPNQGHHAQQGHTVHQLGSPAGETLASKCPQDIRAEVEAGNTASLKVSKYTRESRPS
jgi:hypothetical protein